MEEIKLWGLAAPTDWLNSQTGLKLNGKQTIIKVLQKLRKRHERKRKKKTKTHLVNISSVISIERECISRSTHVRGVMEGLAGLKGS